MGDIAGDTVGRLVVSDSVEVPAGTYVSSVRVRSKVRRLHKVGACHRTPGVDYMEFEVHGTSFPSASCFDVVCAVCFPDFISEADGAASSGGASSSSSASASSALD